MKKLALICFLNLILFSLSPVKGNGKGSMSRVSWKKGVIIARDSARIRVNPAGTPIDPETGRVISINQARIFADRKARERVLLRLVESIKGLRIDGEFTLKHFIETGTITQQRLETVLSRKVKLVHSPGDFYTAACTALVRIGDILPVVPYRYPEESFPQRTDNPIKTDYSSLIIDTRGLDIRPMVLPAIYNQSGLEVYGRYFVDIRNLLSSGIVLYAHTEDEAMQTKIVGEHPFFTVAIKSLKKCPVISDKDVKKIFSSKNTINNLKKCRVIFIIDREKAQ